MRRPKGRIVLSYKYKSPTPHLRACQRMSFLGPTLHNGMAVRFRVNRSSAYRPFYSVCLHRRGKGRNDSCPTIMVARRNAGYIAVLMLLIESHALSSYLQVEASSRASAANRSDPDREQLDAQPPRPRPDHTSRSIIKLRVRIDLTRTNGS